MLEPGFAGARAAAELEHQVVPAVERRLLHSHRPGAVAGDEREVRLEPRAEGGWIRRREQREKAVALGGHESTEPVHEFQNLGRRRERGIEGRQVPPLVLEVALPAHRAEREVAEGKPSGRKPQPEREAAAAACGVDLGGRRAPGEGRRPPGRVADGERGALVGRVGPQQHHATAPVIETELHRVPARVAKESGAIALIRGRIVQAGLGTLEHRAHRGRLER